MMAFSLKRAVLSLLSLSSLVVDASPTPKDVNVVTERGASGYQNAVYFVNWYGGRSSLTRCFLFLCSQPFQGYLRAKLQAPSAPRLAD